MKICELAIHDMQSVKCQEILEMERERKGINFLQWIYTNVTYLLFYSFFLSAPQLLHQHSFFLFQFPSSFSFICQYLSMYFKDITFSIFLLILLYFSLTVNPVKSSPSSFFNDTKTICHTDSRMLITQQRKIVFSTYLLFLCKTLMWIDIFC